MSDPAVETAARAAWAVVRDKSTVGPTKWEQEWPEKQQVYRDSLAAALDAVGWNDPERVRQRLVELEGDDDA